MTVLVTGSSGHIGGAIARFLLEQGHRVIGLSRRNAALPPEILQVRADITARDFIDSARAAIGSCDAVVHAAANLTKAPYDPALSITNGLGTQRVLQVAEALDARSFVFISGVGVIGRPVRIPITEDHPVAPLTAYHASKLYGEQLSAIARSGGLPTVTLRLTAPVGPGMPPGRILTSFVERATAGEPLVLHGRGTRRQNYVDVRDVANATASCIERGVTGLFNIGGAATVANIDLAQRCVDVLASTSAIEFSGEPDPDDDISWDVSSRAASEAFGYEPEFSLETSIQAIA